MTLPLLDPRNDLVFKMLFTSSLPLLSDLINAVRYGEPPIPNRRYGVLKCATASSRTSASGVSCK